MNKRKLRGITVQCALFIVFNTYLLTCNWDNQTDYQKKS